MSKEEERDDSLHLHNEAPASPETSSPRSVEDETLAADHLLVNDGPSLGSSTDSSGNAVIDAARASVDASPLSQSRPSTGGQGYTGPVKQRETAQDDDEALPAPDRSAGPCDVGPSHVEQRDLVKPTPAAEEERRRKTEEDKWPASPVRAASTSPAAEEQARGRSLRRALNKRIRSSVSPFLRYKKAEEEVGKEGRGRGHLLNNLNGASASELDSDYASPSRPGSQTSRVTPLHIPPFRRRRHRLGPTKDKRRRCTAKLEWAPLADGEEKVLLLQYSDDQGREGQLDMENGVCAFSVSLFAEPGRAQVEGQILIVPKAKSLTRGEWASWVQMLLLNLSMAAFFSTLLGPITAVSVIALFILLREEIDTTLLSDYKLTPEQIHDIKAVVGLVAFVTNMTSFSPTWTGALVVTAMLTVVALIWRDIFVLPTGFRYTSPTRPIVLTFGHQSDIPRLLSFREQVKKEPTADAKMNGVAVGSYYVETALSVLLYHDIYNSLRLRRLAHFFIVFALPVIFAFQVLHTFGPRVLAFLSRVQQSVDADYGVRIARSVAYVIRASDLLPGPPEFLTIAVSRLFNVLDTLTIWTAYFSAWIVPVDEAITYFRVKFEPLRYIFVSFLRGLAPLGDAVRLIVVSTSQMLLPMASRMGIVVRIVNVTAMRPVHEVRELIERLRRLLRGDIAVLMKKGQEERESWSEASALPTPMSMETFDYGEGEAEDPARQRPGKPQSLPMPRRPRPLE